MTELAEALQALLEQSGLPVWRGGCVPPEASCPYLVWRLTLGETGTLTIDAVSREGSDESPALLDRAAALFPFGGRLLQLTDGWVAVWPQKQTWIEEKQGARVARLQCTMKEWMD